MFNARSGLMVTALMILSACQVPGGTTGTASPKPKASTAPAAAMLLKPADGGTVLSGTVEIDAHYLLGTGKGKLLGAAGGNVIAAGGGNLLGAAGGNLLGAAGGNLIGAAGGNLIGKRKYGVAATNATKLGETLPAAEMEVQVFDMATGQVLTLGVDAQGKAVTSIYTNASGAYRVYLPASITGKNVRVVASVPETKDARLAYQVVSAFGGEAPGVISEDTALMTSYYTEAFVSRLERMFEQDQAGNLFGQAVPAALKALVDPLVAEVKAANAKAKVTEMTPTQRRALARKATDALLAYVPLETVTFKESGELVLPKLVETLHEFRLAAGKKMTAEGADYFDKQPYVVAANVGRAEADRYVIKRPSDLNDFVLRRYLTTTESGVSRGIIEVLTSIDLPEARMAMINDAMESLSSSILLVLMTNPDAKKRLIATIEAGR